MLHTQMVDLTMVGGGDEADILAAFDAAIRSHHLSDADKVAFSARKLEYLEEVGGDIAQLAALFFLCQSIPSDEASPGCPGSKSTSRPTKSSASPRAWAGRASGKRSVSFSLESWKWREVELVGIPDPSSAVEDKRMRRDQGGGGHVGSSPSAPYAYPAYVQPQAVLGYGGSYAQPQAYAAASVAGAGGQQFYAYAPAAAPVSVAAPSQSAQF